MELRVTSVEIGPELAATWLEKNVSNRPVRRHWVITLAKCMTMGRWIDNGSMIQFDERGNLFDGQHRLLAIIKSGVTVRMMVRFHAPEGTDKITDIGMVKRMSDIKPLENANVIYASIRFLLAYESEGTSGRQSSKMMAWEVEDVFARHPNLKDWAIAGRAIAKQLSKGGLSGGPATFLAYLIGSVGTDQSRQFLAQLETGIGIEEGTPILAYRSVMIGGSASRVRDHNVSIAAIARGIVAWNATCLGRSLARIIWTRNDMPECIGSPVVRGVAKAEVQE